MTFEKLLFVLDYSGFEAHDDLVSLPGQSFVSSGSESCSLPDEDHSASRPHSFPG